VIGVAADLFEVVVLTGDADALLTVDRPFVRPRARAEEHVLELVHAGVGEHQRRVVERHDAGRRHERVAVLQGEEVDELAADVVGGWHGIWVQIAVMVGRRIVYRGSDRVLAQRLDWVANTLGDLGIYAFTHHFFSPAWRST